MIVFAACVAVAGVLYKAGLVTAVADMTGWN